jgi:hypothetical protein
MIFQNFFRGKIPFFPNMGGKFSAEFYPKFSPEKMYKTRLLVTLAPRPTGSKTSAKKVIFKIQRSGDC